MNELMHDYRFLRTDRAQFLFFPYRVHADSKVTDISVIIAGDKKLSTEDIKGLNPTLFVADSMIPGDVKVRGRDGTGTACDLRFSTGTGLRGNAHLTLSAVPDDPIFGYIYSQLHIPVSIDVPPFLAAGENVWGILILLSLVMLFASWTTSWAARKWLLDACLHEWHLFDIERSRASASKPERTIAAKQSLDRAERIIYDFYQQEATNRGLAPWIGIAIILLAAGSAMVLPRLTTSFAPSQVVAIGDVGSEITHLEAGHRATTMYIFVAALISIVALIANFVFPAMQSKSQARKMMTHGIERFELLLEKGLFSKLENVEEQLSRHVEVVRRVGRELSFRRADLASTVSSAGSKIEAEIEAQRAAIQMKAMSREQGSSAAGGL